MRYTVFLKCVWQREGTREQSKFGYEKNHFLNLGANTAGPEFWHEA